MELDQRLVDAATHQLTRRWTGNGWAVATAMYLDDDHILTSVSLDNLNAAVGGWGGDVQVGVLENGPSGWRTRTLRELNPYY